MVVYDRKALTAKTGLNAAITLSILSLLILSRGLPSQSLVFGYPSTASSVPPKPVVLGAATGFGAVAGLGVNNSGDSKVAGNLGSTGPITGFPPGNVTGTIHSDDSLAHQATDDLARSYGALSEDSCNVELASQNLAGLDLQPGVYCYSSGALLSGTLTLNPNHDANAMYVFEIGGGLTLSNDSQITMIGGDGCNVFWEISGTTFIGAQTTFAGSILSAGNIMMGAGANITGAAMSEHGSLVMHSDSVGAQCSSYMWKHQVAATSAGTTGCFQVSYPSAEWVSEPCLYHVGQPHTVGPPVGGCDTETSTGTCDYAGKSSGTLINHAEDSFLTGGGYSVNGISGSCSAGTREYDQSSGDNCAYSIQLNSNRWVISGICGTGTNACWGWEQFVFTSDYT